MKPTPILAAVAGLLLSTGTPADPIHPVTDGAYWHHDSNWIFPARIGVFERVGIPQDLSGSRDAAAWYAHEFDGQRLVAVVEIREKQPGLAEDVAAAAEPRRVLHVRESGEWRVTIYLDGTAAPAPEHLETFVKGQRWDTLDGAR